MRKNVISFVIPCYCSEDTIEAVIQEIIDEVAKQDIYQYEIILVNDCSTDHTSTVLKDLAEKNHNIVIVEFAKNFGQPAAILAGFQKVTGEYMVCMDDDGQMPVESVFDLIRALEDGADVVFGRYDSPKQNVFRNIGSRVNVWMSEVLLSKPKDLYISSFWAARRYVIDELVKYDAAYPYMAGLLLRTTRNMVNIPVVHRPRESGSSGYTFFKLLNLWLNGFTAFSVKPLRFATFCGIFCAAIGFIFSIVMVIRKFLNPDILIGYASTITVILFIGGMLMMLLGLVGEYVGRIYISINKAPQYVIRGVIDQRDLSEEKTEQASPIWGEQRDGGENEGR